jgi:uncharacterized membrane protein YfcA
MMTGLYLNVVNGLLHTKYTGYNILKIVPNLDLSIQKNFMIVSSAGFFAGILQGILGVGSGTFIMGVFVTLNLHPLVAAATSGYQILFIGFATFIQ